jgi:aspartate aminotransferase
MQLSERVKSLLPSPTLAIDSKAKKMKSEGVDIIGFGAGEPDFDTPDYIKEAAINAIREGYTKYTPASGSQELKKAICEKLKRDNGLEYDVSEVIVSCGAKHVLYNVFQAICNDDDEVILPAPYWVSYTEQIKLAGGVPVIVETTRENAFKVMISQIEAAITERTKAIVLNNPCNPTGAVYDKDTLQALAELAVSKGLLVISDEIYEKLVYDGAKHFSIASFGPEIRDLTVTINGVSKSNSMTGWRIGYAAGNSSLIKAMSNLQSHSTSNPNSIAQKATIAALMGPEEAVEEMKEKFSQRRDRLVELINTLDGVSCDKPMGAFYVFADISGLYGREIAGRKIRSSDDVCDVLLDAARVAVVPGSGFGAPNYIRFSYSTSMESIEEGMKRIAQVIGVRK